MGKIADCPFCNSENVRHYKFNNDSPDIVCCLTCHGSTGSYWKEGEALLVWNSVWKNLNGA